jgi:enamine deaminase RidA (YjgF/YER057c/UK114 family)
VDIDVCAVQSHGQKLVTCAVENPEQLNPYQYDQQVLEGLPILNEKVKHPPEFERAKLLVVEGHVRLFISGTASIIGQETIGIGDIEKQTHCTISNIEKLTDPVNVRKSYPGLKTGRFKYSFVRVYVKDRQDLEAAMSICRQKFGNVPVSYVVVDVCRDELLVEIEGEMIFESVSDLS